MLSTNTQDDLQLQRDHEVDMATASASMERKFEIRLEQILQEFLGVQRRFHLHEKNFLEALIDERKNFPEELRKDLDRVIDPYRNLVANPFPEELSGDLHQDIMKIFQIIAERDRHFTCVFAAQISATIYHSEFYSFLNTIKSEKNILDGIKSRLINIMTVDGKEVSQPLKTNVIRELEKRISLPFQNLPRYQLLLKTLRDQLVKTRDHLAEDQEAKTQRSDEDEQLRVSIDRTDKMISNLKEDSKLMDEFYDIGKLILEISEFKQLYMNSNTKDAKQAALPLDVLTYAVRKYIDGAMIQIANGGFDMICIKKGLLFHLKEFYEAVQAAWQQASYLYRFYNYSYDLVASQKGSTEKLGEYVAKLDKEVADAEALKLLFGVQGEVRLTKQRTLPIQRNPVPFKAPEKVVTTEVNSEEVVADDESEALPAIVEEIPRPSM